MSADMSYLYETGSGLEVPGIEAVLEYGDASTYAKGGIPGALRINDRSKPDQVRVTDLAGLHDDPDVGDSRTERAVRWGERAGLLVPRGRTVGITGYVRSNNVFRMRDLWRRMRSQFGRSERDLIVHPPNEAPHYVNVVSPLSPFGWLTTTDFTFTSTGALSTFTDGTLSGILETVTMLGSGPALLLYANPVPWSGEDLWMTAIVRVPTGTISSISLSARILDAAGNLVGTWTATGSGTVASPASGTYYQLSARMSALTDAPFAGTKIAPQISMVLGTHVDYTLRAARVAAVLLDADEASPAGYLGPDLPGFEALTADPTSSSRGPLYVVNQVRDPDVTGSSAWANDSTSGATVDTAGALLNSWPAGRSSYAWNTHNPSTTSRTLAIRYPSTLSDPGLFVVASGRSYRAHVRALVQQSYAFGSLQVVWLNNAGTAIQTSTVDSFDPVASGAAAVDVDLDGVVVAPNLAVRAYMRIAATTASTTTNDRFKLLVAEPRFLDVSEYDPGESAPLDGTQETAHGLVTNSLARVGASIVATPTGARRRIPRPFLLRKVRSIWDGKAPETQRSLQVRRDFTMSLRASDPRMYVLEERHAQLTFTGTPSRVSSSMSSYSALLNSAGTEIANDVFSGVGTTALNGMTADLGGAWTTAGGTTDFAGTTLSGGDQMGRSTLSAGGTRFGLLGGSRSGGVLVEAYFSMDAPTSSAQLGTGVYQSVVARYVDASNHLRLSFKHTWSPLQTTFELVQVVAGTPTTLASGALPTNPISHVGIGFLHLTVYSSGLITVRINPDTGGEYRTNVVSPAVATGGALASGSQGIADASTGSSAITRYYQLVNIGGIPGDPGGPPPGFTYDAASTLESDVVWSSSTLGFAFPRSGVSLQDDELAPPPTGYLSQNNLAKMYYSAGAVTYATPQVTVVGNCVTSNTGPDYSLFSDSLVGGVWQYSYIAALLKRVSASTWIEVRYNSANRSAMNAAHASPTAPQSVELWCSHTTGGTATVTKLLGVDIPTGSITDGTVKHLRAWLGSDDVVWIELWNQDPNPIDSGLLLRRSFTLTSSLITLLGHAVTGSAGMNVYLGRWADGAGAGQTVDSIANNWGFPYVTDFEAINANSTFLLDCPAIGDADEIPLRLQLRGDVDTPTIVLANTDTGEVRVLKLSGVFPESDPVTVDMDAGTIVSASGANYFDRRLPGSHFFALAPGNNAISIQANGWSGSASNHVVAYWRDCLR